MYRIDLLNIDDSVFIKIESFHYTQSDNNMIACFVKIENYFYMKLAERSRLRPVVF